MVSLSLQSDIISLGVIDASLKHAFIIYSMKNVVDHIIMFLSVGQQIKLGLGPTVACKYNTPPRVVKTSNSIDSLVSLHIPR